MALRAPIVFSGPLSHALCTWRRATGGAPVMTYVTTSTLMLPAESIISERLESHFCGNLFSDHC